MAVDFDSAAAGLLVRAWDASDDRRGLVELWARCSFTQAWAWDGLLCLADALAERGEDCPPILTRRLVQAARRGRPKAGPNAGRDFIMLMEFGRLRGFPDRDGLPYEIVADILTTAFFDVKEPDNGSANVQKILNRTKWRLRPVVLPDNNSV